MLGVGVSTMLMQVMMMVQQTIMYNVAAQFGGNEWQILLGASLRIHAFAFIPLWNLSQGFQPAVGTNYGAEKFTHVRQMLKVFLLGGTVLSLVFYLPVMLFPKTMLSLFITDSAIAGLGVGSLRVFFSTYVVLPLMILSIILFQAIGRGEKAALLTVLQQVGCLSRSVCCCTG